MKKFNIETRVALIYGLMISVSIFFSVFVFNKVKDKKTEIDLVEVKSEKAIITKEYIRLNTDCGYLEEQYSVLTRQNIELSSALIDKITINQDMQKQNINLSLEIIRLNNIILDQQQVIFK